MSLLVRRLASASPGSPGGGGGGGGGDIDFVGAGTFVSGTSSPLAPTLPTHSEGDYILIMVADRQGSGAVMTVSGYDCLGHFPSNQFVGAPNGQAVWLFGKVAGASESTPSVVADAAVTAGYAAQCFVYSGVAGLDTGARWNTNNLVAGDAAPPQTRAATDGAWVVAFGASFDDNSLGLLSGSEEGYTLRASNNNSSANMCMAWADKALTSAGDTQVGPTFDQTAAGSDTWIALGQITLLPDGATPNQPRLMRQLYGLGTTSTSEQTMQLRYDDIQAGDLILVWVGTNSTTSTLAVTGFTQEIHADGTTSRSLDLFYKVADGSETSVAITNPEGGFAWEATVQIWRGVDTSTPFDVANTENNAASGATFAGPAITPTTAHAVVVSAAALQAYPGAPAFSNAQGFQPSFLGLLWQTSVSFDQSLFGGDKYVASAAATTAPTWSGSSSTWVGASTALRPAS